MIDARLLWFCPITAAEGDYARKNGAESLEQMFEQAAIDYLDVHRKSVIAP